MMGQCVGTGPWLYQCTSVLGIETVLLRVLYSHTSEVGVRTNYCGFLPVLASTRLWMLVLTLVY